jgi:hypothetical protein
VSGLANRLAVAAWSEMKDSPYSNFSYDELPAKAKARVDRTVAAVLRELAKAADSFNDDLRLHGHQRRDLEALAEVIEKGEQA